MPRKISQLEKTKAKAMRLALTAFRAKPLLGKHCAQLVFFKITDYLKSGMDEDVALNNVLTNNDGFFASKDELTMSLF